MWRTDQVSDSGEIKRVLMKRWLGSTKELTQREARRIADSLVAPSNDPFAMPRATINFTALSDEWRDRVLPMRKPSTQTAMKNHLRRYLLPAFGDMRVDSVGQAQVQGLVVQLVPKMTTHSVMNVVCTLSSILKTAKRWGYSVGNFNRADLEMPRVSAPPKRKHFEPEHVRAIIERATGQWRTLFITAALTGVRPGEVLALSLDSLDLKRGEIEIAQNNDRGRIVTCKSTRSYRRVPMPAVLAAELRRYIADGYRDNPLRLLFVSDALTPLRLSKVVDKRLHPILRELGLPLCGMHAFRHTAASVMLSTGASAKVVQEQLGHEDPETTLGIYGHLIGDEHRRSVEDMARVLLPDVARVAVKQLVVN